MTSTRVLILVVSFALSFLIVAEQVTTLAMAQQILSGPLATLDIKDAIIEPTRGVPKGKLTIAQHFGLSPKWLDPQEHITALTQQHYSYLVHDALIKTMPQGLFTYSLAEHAEMTADFTKAAFRLRQGLKFHDGQPLTTADVKWNYEHYRGVNAKDFKDKLDSSRSDGGIEIVDERTIIFHFKEPFLDFMSLYNGGMTGIGWIVPRHYYEKVGADSFKSHPIGAGPFKFVRQDSGVEMVFEAWDAYWRKVPEVQHIVVRGIREVAARVAGLQSGELDLAYGMTGKLLSKVLKDPHLRTDPNYTAPWVLFFPNWEQPESPFHDKRVRQAVSLAVNREFLNHQETQSLGVVYGNWIGPEFDDSLELHVPEYDPDKAKKLLAEAEYANGFEIDGLIPFAPYYDMGERILTDLAAVGIRGKLITMDGPAYRAKRSQGRAGFQGNRTILHSIHGGSGLAADTIRIFGVCAGASSMICDDKVEALWKRHEASTSPEERKQLSQAIQRYTVEEYLAVPLYINPFVHAVGPKVAGDLKSYYATPQAPYPYPWEHWKVKAE